jgi:hypothetical protein
MAGRRSGWINWDLLGEEAKEDAGDLNYYYEWIEPEPGNCFFVIVVCTKRDYSTILT